MSESQETPELTAEITPDDLMSLELPDDALVQTYMTEYEPSSRYDLLPSQASTTDKMLDPKKNTLSQQTSQIQSYSKILEMTPEEESLLK